jgi:uncharacterized protein with LGFP repeats
MAAIDANYQLNQAVLGQPVRYYQDAPDSSAYQGAYRDYQNGSIYYSTYSGAHDIMGPIKAKWIQKGYVDWGFPTTDQTPTPDGAGYYNHFAYYTPTKTWLGAIDYTPQYGTNAVQGLIADKFQSLGWEALGEATTDETRTPDGAGYYNHFAYIAPNKTWLAAIDYTSALTWTTPEHGLYVVKGLIADKFASLGWEALGEATTDETVTPDGAAYYNHFAYYTPTKTWLAAIDYTPALTWTTPEHGVYLVKGLIADKFAALGWEALGEATPNETPRSDGAVYYNHFAYYTSTKTWLAAIDYVPAYTWTTPQHGEYVVRGLIADYFLSHGGETGPFSYATGDETVGSGSGDRMQVFQNGEIQWQLRGLTWSTWRFTS